MDAKVDYLSWTILSDPRGGGDQLVQDTAVSLVWQYAPAFAEAFGDTALHWQGGKARGHYGASLFQPDTFATIRFGGSASHILIECPGTACQWLRDKGALEAVVLEASERCTRLDLAVDFPGGCSPKEFVGAGYNERFTSHAEIISAEGETEYVGSMKSERYARVYRYNPPHPRAGTLRVEHVLRGDYAKSASQQLGQADVVELASVCGNTWGWRSPDWRPETTTAGKLKATRADRHEPARLRWLYKVVLPAIVKAHREGLLDASEFCQSVVDLAIP